jgi:predicted dehydrogenase
MANLGLPVRRVEAFRPGSDRAGPEKTALVVFEYEGGAVGTLYYSWEVASPLKGLHLSAVYGSEGTATFETNGVFLAVRGRRKRVGMPRVADIAGYGGMWEDFLRALRAGEEPRFDLALAKRDLELLEEAYASMRARG